MSNKLNPDVVTMVNQIKFIYSNAYKKFINIDPARYINTDDLMKDLYIVIPKWDSHASVNYKDTHTDTTSYTINSNGYGYIYVSTNFKMDNILHIYSELHNKGVKKITINLLAFNNILEQEMQILKLLMPFMDDNQQVDVFALGSYVTIFSYDRETRILKIKDKSVKELNKTILNEIHNKVVYEGIDINIMMDTSIMRVFYRRLEGAKNMSIYCYDDNVAMCVIVYNSNNENGVVLNNLKYESKVPSKLKFHCSSIGKKYYPMI